MSLLTCLKAVMTARKPFLLVPQASVLYSRVKWFPRVYSVPTESLVFLHERSACTEET